MSPTQISLTHEREKKSHQNLLISLDKLLLLGPESLILPGPSVLRLAGRFTQLEVYSSAQDVPMASEGSAVSLCLIASTIVGRLLQC